MFDYPVYLIFRAAIAVLNLLPLRALFTLGEIGGSCAWAVLWNYRALASRNMRLALGDELDPAARRRLVHRHFRRMGANMLASIKLSTLPLEKLSELVTTENVEISGTLLNAGRPIVMVLSHIGNWELLAQLLAKYSPGFRKGTVYQTIRNRHIDSYMSAVRSRTGIELFERSKGFKSVVELLRGGGAIGILSDQHAGNHGVWIPFFGRLASTTTLPALLAKRTGAVLISAAMHTTGRARWKLVFQSPIETRDDSVEELTATLNRALETQVRRAPEDWFWVHNRWKTPQPNFLLQEYKRGVHVSDIGTLKPFRILIRASNWLGDSVMTMPAVRAIKHGRPDAHVTVVASAKLAALWQRIAEVDEVIVLPGKSLLRTAKLIRNAGPFDAGVLFPNSLRSALELWLARVPMRVGFAGHRRRWFLTHAIGGLGRKKPPLHQSELYLHLARKLGATPARELPEITHKLQEKSLRIALCPGAEYGPAKRWLPERFVETAAAVSAKTDAHWVLFGTDKDRAVGDVIVAALGPQCTNRIAQTSLDELIDELSQCRLLLTNDTGTMHLAALLRVPTVAIFGSTEPLLTAPMGEANTIIRRHVECSPCFLRECPIDFRCMHEVSVQRVVDAVLARLA